MQEVTTVKTSAVNAFDQLRSGVLVDTSSQARAFSDFLGLSSQGAAQAQSQSSQINDALGALPPQDALQSDPSVSAAVSSATRATTADTALSTAKNAPVSRESFEEAKPILAKAGVSDAEMADLAARVQAGTLTWGQLTQTLGGHMTGAKKSAGLTTAETAQVQSLFQRLGFGPTDAADMAKAVAKGDGMRALSTMQNKLSTMADDASLGLDKDELATFFKALRLPKGASDKLLAQLGEQSTAGDLKNALAQMGVSLKDQQTKSAAADSDLAKSLAKLMDKDAAKSARDASGSATATADGSAGKVGFELKTKDKNDTGWFDQHENSQRKANENVWNSFNAKVREDVSGQAAAAGLASQASQTTQTTAKEGLDALAAGRAAQLSAQTGKAETSQQTKAYSNVAAPKMLDQVTEAMLKDLGQGRKQLTVQLDPENLGRVQVMLQVKGKEVSALLRAEDADTAAMLSANMEGLKKTLEEQGLTVQNIEVQTGLAQQQNQQASFNAEQHNQAQQQQDLSRLFGQLRTLRADSAEVAPDMQNAGAQAILADQGLHIIA